MSLERTSSGALNDEKSPPLPHQHGTSVCRFALACHCLGKCCYYEFTYERKAMEITVYCGSSFGTNPAFREAAAELGAWIGNNGHSLVYGGSRMGLMGVVADAVLEAGGTVFGVEPRFLIETELQHDGLTEFVAVDTMSERKNMMIERGEAFLAMPGGLGTLEEISEIASQIRLKLLDAPCIIYNVAGYYDNFFRYLDRMTTEGFIRAYEAEHIHRAESIDDVAREIARFEQERAGKD